MSQGSLNAKIRFLGQKVCSVAHGLTHRQTHTKVGTEGILLGFQDFFLQPIIKDRPNYHKCTFRDSLVESIKVIIVRLFIHKIHGTIVQCWLQSCSFHSLQLVPVQ